MDIVNDLVSSISSISSEAAEEEAIRDELRNDKGGLIAGIFVLTLTASFVPWFLTKAKITNLVSVVSILTCLSAGVIIGAGFNHILPDAAEEFQSYVEAVAPDNKYGDFPFAHTITIVTMFALICVDKILVSGGLDGEADHNHMDLSQHNHPSPHAAGEIDLNIYTNGDDDDDDVNEDQEEDSTKDDEKEHGHGHGHGHGHNSSNSSSNGHGHGLKKKKKSKKEHGHGHNHDHSSNGHSHKDEKDSEKVNVSSKSKAWVFLVALSLHSIFDGLGLGSETQKDSFYGLLIAVLAHKFLDGLVLGIAIKYAYFSFKFSCIALVFAAAMTPLGIGIGMAISSAYESSTDAYLVKGIILSITCGSFIYISLIELLPSGLCQKGWPKLKLAVAFLGYSVMAILALWV
ncbi:zinc/iron permease [Dictyostelium discoideum AX4]|uniref:Protein zntC n=1 Tax=Dictyostelium discoideum TaxID=44689 RepID=ZNTC_DICDI|nr:zinc/iron permease [Dictyostelium discoideum AX4]Q54MB9.1 RecName: Full=Protein zntC [Dictyostelium discoideum]EAL64403.1 zinc/iron permease [Dictyostelium discoideum AX4]|eukprot:XP_637915.1 zinc/iron permease [Dictyostelium discoideum AX4]